MAHAPVGIDYEGTRDTTLDSFAVGVNGIVAGGVDERHQIAVSTGEGRLLRYIIVFIYFHIAHSALSIGAYVHAACLRVRSLTCYQQTG